MWLRPTTRGFLVSVMEVSWIGGRRDRHSVPRYGLPNTRSDGFQPSVRRLQVLHDRFLRSRISANTFHAGSPSRPTDLATLGRSARRNGFAAFSSAIVDGMVGLREAISCSTSSARFFSAALSGS